MSGENKDETGVEQDDLTEFNNLKSIVHSVLRNTVYDNISYQYMRPLEELDKNGGNCVYISRLLAEKITFIKCKALLCKKKSPTLNHVCLLLDGKYIIEPASAQLNIFPINNFQHDSFSLSQLDNNIYEITRDGSLVYVIDCSEHFELPQDNVTDPFRELVESIFSGKVGYYSLRNEQLSWSILFKFTVSNERNLCLEVYEWKPKQKRLSGTPSIKFDPAQDKFLEIKEWMQTKLLKIDLDKFIKDAEKWFLIRLQPEEREKAACEIFDLYNNTQGHK